MSKRAVTLLDIAADAGVSRATVSLVIRGSDRITPATSERVLASMRRLGYVYNRGAAGMRSRKSGTLAFVVTDVANPYFAEMTRSIEEVFGEAGYVLILAHNHESTATQAQVLTRMREYNVDGLLLTPATGTTRKHLEMLADGKLPHVLVTRYVEGHDVSYVGGDNVLGARLATEHLLGHGSEKIAFLGGSVDSTSRRDREQGFREALMAQRGSAAAPSLPTEISRVGGHAAAIELLSRGERPDAIVCYNDIVAFGVLTAARELGIEVGRELRVIGFDDIDEARLQLPSLTTMAVRPGEIGALAARQLRSLMTEESGPQTLIVTPELVARASCGCRADDRAHRSRLLPDQDPGPSDRLSEQGPRPSTAI